MPTAHDALTVLRRHFPCPHFTDVEVHPGLCVYCAADDGASCPIREACDAIEHALPSFHEDEEETFTHRLSDVVPVTLIRIDLMVVAGLVFRLLEKEEAAIAKLRARADVPEERIEKTAWRVSQRRRLFEQLRGAAGPMYDEEYARKKAAESAASRLGED